VLNTDVELCCGFFDSDGSFGHSVGVWLKGIGLNVLGTLGLFEF